MENKKPNIFSFVTKSKSRYIYDACTNRVFPAPEPYLEIIQNFNILSREEIINKFAADYGSDYCAEAYNTIENWVTNENAFFNYDDKVNEFTYSKEELTAALKRNSTPHIILGVTEDCNFRCRYCVFGGQYEHFRTHTKNYMTKETALKSIDYFLAEVANPETAGTLLEQSTISFYGGEPLLAFPLIKEAVNYILDKYKGQEFDFRMTTNGYLLRKNVADFLVRNNFGIAVSLDGPREDHDRNRVLAGGEKTFDMVFNNLMYIREHYPDYYKKKVMLQVSYDWNSDLIRINEFFKKKRNILPKGKTYSQVNTKDTGYYSQFTEEEHNAFLERMRTIKKEYVEYLLDSESENKPGIEAIFRGSLYKFSCRPHHKRVAFTGICSPGSRLFVSSNGDFHLCERINSAFPIGNCNTGLDFDKIYKLKKDFHETVVKEGNCSSCIARQGCPICFVGVAGEGCFSADGVCENARQTFKQDVAEYYSLFERNPLIAKKFLQDASFLELK